MSYLLSALAGCGVGVVGTGLGGVAAALIKRVKNRRKTESFLMGLSGGVMLAVVFFELLPESIRLSGPVMTVIGAVLGAVFVAVLSRLLPSSEGGKDKKLGMMLFLGIALHNLPEGLAVGAGLNEPDSLGIGLGLLIMMHDVPEGLAMAIPLKESGMKNPAVILLCAAAGLPTAAGAAIGFAVGGISEAFIAASVAFAGGAMLILTLAEIIPECYKEGGLLSMAFSCAAGFAAGALMGLLV